MSPEFDLNNSARVPESTMSGVRKRASQEVRLLFRIFILSRRYFFAFSNGHETTDNTQRREME